MKAKAVEVNFRLYLLLFLLVGIAMLSGCADLGEDFRGVYDPYAQGYQQNRYPNRYGQRPQYKPRYQPRQQYYGQRYQEPRYQAPQYPNDDPDRDAYECQNLAKAASENNLGSYAGAGVKGGALGAATGAVACAVFGCDPGAGAKGGAAVVGGLSMLFKGMSGRQRSELTYVRCMQNRGHEVLNSQLGSRY